MPVPDPPSGEPDDQHDARSSERPVPEIVLPSDPDVQPTPRTLAQFRMERVYLRDSVEYNRIVNITDAVVSIAITLLVLQLAVPAANPGVTDTNEGVAQVLGDLYEPALAFVLSFVIIAFSWFGHHRFVDRLTGFDNRLILWNFCYLFALVLVPFASDLVGEYGDTDLALSVYAVVMAVLFGIDFPGRLLASRQGLLADHYTRRQWWAHGVLSLTASGVFILSIPIFLVTGGKVGAWVWILIWPVSWFLGRVVVKADAAALDAHKAARPG